MSTLETSRKMRSPAVSWILAGIPIIGLTGSVMHFVYGWSGNLAVVGLIAPVNESIWEHLKLIFWPSLLWMCMGYRYIKRRDEISAPRWFTSGASSLFIGPLFIAAFYYTYTGAFGIHSLFLDILSFLLGVSAAQLIFLHGYRFMKANQQTLILACISVVFFTAAFLLFTFFTPEIPLFHDPVTGSYGI